ESGLKASAFSHSLYISFSVCLKSYLESIDSYYSIIDLLEKGGLSSKWNPRTSQQGVEYVAW
ncbi:hypothetical protein KKD03_01815, partial [Patescibacteria group bacterium]|nr:hypothetical protein [Patescibacteria group bacterium]